ncbi:cupin domain-containing protein [Agromyces sp. CFH 90414]|uniref:Cupin domain-containing protein n=1 Tax=Agromyces agglutinans TaxID=2662258 RepID=A0A6I2FCB0_9MICO|nr:cupin domain-containing protein [Agromyces agglutinans]MRG60330.1 cupin domain-containing protein [Agromyces agglutinans]
MPSATYSTEITLAPATTPELPEIVSGESLRLGTSNTRRFVGLEHGASVSYFLVDNQPGEGPGLHWHPYAETWVLIDGTARIMIGDRTFVANAGDTATVPAGVWHGFTNVGEGRLRVLCIHASAVIVQTWADED